MGTVNSSLSEVNKARGYLETLDKMMGPSCETLTTTSDTPEGCNSFRSSRGERDGGGISSERCIEFKRVVKEALEDSKRLSELMNEEQVLHARLLSSTVAIEQHVNEFAKGNSQ